MHTHPVAGKRRRLSFVIMVAGYAAAWMVAVPVLANLAPTGFIARHHLEALSNHHLRYPPYAGDAKTAVDAAMPVAGRAGSGGRSPPCLPSGVRPMTGAIAVADVL